MVLGTGAGKAVLVFAVGAILSVVLWYHPPPPAATKPFPKFCPNCGTPTRSGKAFCTNCGSRLTGGP